MAKNPAFIAERKKVYDELIEAQNNKYKGKNLKDIDDDVAGNFLYTSSSSFLTQRVKEAEGFLLRS